jgi:eukaryotic-like serine/threonine-protein kinase
LLSMRRTGRRDPFDHRGAAMFIPTSDAVVADRYRLLEEIGRGGMGVIWRARVLGQEGECAIKFIHASCANDPEVRRRFVREARTAASLRGPSSVSVLEVDEWQGCLFIAMELLRGESLEARLEREGRLSPELTLEILDQVARGLIRAHAARLVHRDLKPENIFLVAAEPLLVKLLDFGIAKHMDAITGAQTATGALVGTSWYMSPEQALGAKGIDFRSDLWSLAVVAFRCLTGTLPFDGDGLGRVLLEIMHGPMPSPRTFNSSLPASVDEWWFRTMQRDPAGRPPSVTALVNELRDAFEPRDSWPESAPRAEPSPALLPDTLPPDTLPPDTLPPVAASQRRSTPAMVRYSMASAPALVFAGWMVGSWLWPASTESWRGEPPGPSASSDGVSNDGASPRAADRGRASAPGQGAPAPAAVAPGQGEAAPAVTPAPSRTIEQPSLAEPGRAAPLPARTPAKLGASARDARDARARPPARSRGPARPPAAR